MFCLFQEFTDPLFYTLLFTQGATEGQLQTVKITLSDGN